MAAKFNFKTFLVNHSEKMIGALVVALALWGFASASWKPTDVFPGKLVQQANSVREEIQNKTVWPDDQRKQFLVADASAGSEQSAGDYVQDLARELAVADNLDHQSFATDVTWYPLLNPLREKRGRVVVLAPMNPEALGISIPLAFPLDEEEEEEDKKPVRKKPKKKVSAARTRAADEFGGSAVEDPADTPGNTGAVAAMVLGLGRGGGIGFGRGGDEDDDDTGYGGGPGGAAILPTADREVEWRSGVSVRMIVNLRNQRKEISKALHIKGVQQTQEFVDYQSMHIERKEYRYGEWSDWEPLLLDDVGEILEETLGQDIDIVSPAVTRDGITMPLPRRGAGKWLEHQASHQMLVDFKLDEDEQEMMNQVLAIMARDAEEANRNAPPERKKRRGFSAYTQSVESLRRGARNGFDRGRDQWRNSVRDQIRSAYDGNERDFGEREEALLDSQLDSLNGDESGHTADERLLLVRFFDFTAERGITYQYRVRLEMYNPNYQVNIDELEFPELRNEETIFSEWSAPTDSILVPPRYRNHVKKAKTGRLGQRSVNFGVYYESDGVLPVFENLWVDVGLPVGGKEQSDRVDLEKQVLEGGDVEVSTREVVASVVPTGGIVAGTRGELKKALLELDSEDEVVADLLNVVNRAGNQDMVGDLVNVIDSAGNIVLKYASEDAPELRADEELVENILKNYADWRMDGGEGGLGGGLRGDDDERGGKGRRRGLSVGSALGKGSGGRRTNKKKRDG